LNILVVEDNAGTAASAQLLLEQWGHQVQVAGDGQSALQAADACPADLILLDLGLPDLDGFEVAKQLRQRRADRRPIIIAVTGLGEEAQRLHSYEIGIDLHLVKPVQPEESQALLERLQSAKTQYGQE
jgi:DNA-binding response OmpR family regulator